MFRKISTIIALQFTAFVFLLFMINGMLFLAADFGNARRQAGDRIVRTGQYVIEHTRIDENGLLIASLPPPMRERVRIADHNGHAVYSGAFFEDIPFNPIEGISTVSIDDEQYAIVTTAMVHNGQRIGTMQVADIYRLQFRDLPERSFIYLLISAAVSALTFAVGLFFARRSLAPAQRMMERLEQFTQDASHELRTPIAALQSSLDLALRNKKYEEGIVSAKEDVQQLSQLVDRLLELTRLDTLLFTKETVDFSALVHDTVERYQLMASEKHVLLVEECAPHVFVKGDASLLRQVLSNLLTNAIKYSKQEGGTVRIRLTKHLLSIQDEGIGISAAALAHIFNRFFQEDTSRAKGGYGLGLALVKRIVELHGWSITVKSILGNGTVFTLTFA